MVIAIHVGPTLTGHKMRGVGVYTKLLLDALSTYKTPHTFIQFSDIHDIHGSYDIIHYPFFDPFFLTLPVVKSRPTIVTVHDLIPLVYPDKFPRGIRGEIKWQIQKMSLMGAKRIITDSFSSKKDIAKIIGFPKDAIDVVYLAPSPVFHPVNDKKILNSISKKYRLPEQFLLYVGDVNWNKNIEGLLDAFSVFHKKYPEIHLVLVGKAFVNHELPETKRILQKIQALRLEQYILTPGFVSDTELACLYSMAVSLVVPSWYEGFGLPVLEAFSCGCPVVASDNSSLKEIRGPSIPCDAGNPLSIAGAMGKIMALSARERETVKEQGFVWVKQYNWERVARETIASYEKVVE